MRERIREMWEKARTQNVPPKEMAAAVFVGTFLGVVPLYGIQTLCVLAAASVLRLNKWVALLAAQISMPPMAAVLVMAGLVIGDFVRFGELRWVSLAEGQDFLEGLWMFSGALPDRFLSCLLGDIILGAFLGAIFSLLAYRWAARREQRLMKGEAD